MTLIKLTKYLLEDEIMKRSSIESSIKKILE